MSLGTVESASGRENLPLGLENLCLEGKAVGSNQERPKDARRTTKVDHDDRAVAGGRARTLGVTGRNRSAAGEFFHSGRNWTEDGGGSFWEVSTQNKGGK